MEEEEEFFIFSHQKIIINAKHQIRIVELAFYLHFVLCFSLHTHPCPLHLHPALSLPVFPSSDQN